MVRVEYGRIKKREGKGKRKRKGGEGRGKKGRGGLNAVVFSVFMVLC